MVARITKALPAARGDEGKGARGKKEGPDQAGADRLTKIGCKSILRHFQMQQVVEPKPKYNISLHVKMPQNTFTMKKRSTGYASVRLCYKFDEICAIMSLFGV